MPPLESTLLLLVAPGGAWALGSAVIASAYADLRSMPPDPSSPVLPGRIVTFFALSFTPTVFGSILWFLFAGVEADFGPFSGLPASLAFWAAATFAFVAVNVVGVEAWITRSRLRQYTSREFGRVLPFVVIAETAVVFSLVLAFVTFGTVVGFLQGTETLTEARAARIAVALEGYALSTFALPVAAALSNRVRDIATVRSWVRALSFMEIGAGFTVVGLAWAFLQISGP